MTRRAWLGLPLLGGCSGTDVAAALTPVGGGSERRDIAYGPLPRQRLDLTRPAGSPRAAVVFLYGGSFDSGDRGDYRFVSRALAARGFAVAVPDYRVWPAGRWPDFLEDAALATRWAGTEFRATPLFVMGHSAGGFLALALALDPRWLGEYRTTLAGAIGLAGVYEWRPREAPLTDIFEPAPDGMIRAAPVEAALVDAPPLLLLHGEMDTTVRPEQSIRLHARSSAAGGRAALRLYPGVAHIGILAAIAAPLRALGLDRAPVLDDVLAFLSAG